MGTFAARFTRQKVHFANATAYRSYRVIFPTVSNAATANSMQIAEVELLGTIQAGPVAPKLEISVAGGKVSVTFTGILESSAAVGGPYVPVVGAASPYPVDVTGSTRFFRSR